MFRLKLFWLGLSKKLWPKVSLYALLSVGVALIAIWLRHYVPEAVAGEIERETVSTILGILGSSMLAVTTFSLSTMVSAYGAATSSVTPRATQLLVQDSTTQNVLATFLGSFIFSLVGIICLNSGVYEGNGRWVLFITTIGVVILILITLIRWIEHLSKLGRVGETTRMVEKVSTESMIRRAENPYLGGNPLRDIERDIPQSASSLCFDEYGYLQYIDIEALSRVAEKAEVRIFLVSLPGTFVTPTRPVARIEGNVSEKERHRMKKTFTIADERTFEQDPRFGLCVLSEIASRALPPTANDTGTAIDVIGRLERVLGIYADRIQEKEVKYKRLWVPGLEIADLFEDAFCSVMRDGMNYFEIQIRLLKAFSTLSRIGNPDFLSSARHYSRQALLLIERSRLLDDEKKRLGAVAETCARELR